jgi:hypothetical protein
MEDKAYEYYKSITNDKYVEQFSNCCFSGLTKGEIYYGGGFSQEDNKYYTDTDKYKDAYEVKGVLYDERINSFTRIEYSFNSLECAEKYFEQVIKIFPLSRMKIIRTYWQQLRCYA